MLDIERLEELIAKRKDIDAQIMAVAAGSGGSRKPQACSSCGSTEHNARACPQKKGDIVRLAERQAS